MASKRGVVTRTVNTRSASASAGHPVGSEAPTMLPDNFGPRTIMSLPANFLVDPDSVRRRGRRSTPHPQPRQSGYSLPIPVLDEPQSPIPALD